MRTSQNFFQDSPLRISFVSHAKLSQHINWARALGSNINVQFDRIHCPLNEEHAFESLVVDSIDSGDRERCIVIFDTFVCEEQYGWMVRKWIPNALRIVDTQDLHLLRRARMKALSLSHAEHDEFGICLDPDLRHPQVFEHVLRELTSLKRSDLVLAVSSFEIDLLINKFGFNPRKILHAPFLFDFSQIPKMNVSFEKRKRFVSLGNWQHPANRDSVQFLKKVIWPRILKRIPNAEINVYGANPTKKDMQLDDSSNGFRLRGPYVGESIQMLSQHKVLLSPLRFGAGIKGKIAESWVAGTPVVTTAIGSEGMRRNDHFPGISASTVYSFVERACDLYSNKTEWNKYSLLGRESAEAMYDESSLGPKLWEDISMHLSQLRQNRATDWDQDILWQSRLRGTEWMSKYIQAKNLLAQRRDSVSCHES